MDDAQARQLERIKAEIADSFDEELEMQLEEDRLDELVAEGMSAPAQETLDRKVYFRELFRLQHELVRLQDWVQYKKLKVVVIFEGRDSAGKGGAIKRVTQRLNPRVCRVVALPAPTERERNQWYFQRYVPHLPTAGEIVLFDRSWYNRAGVERVMGFCTAGRARGILPLGAGVRAHAGPLGDHPDQILVLDHRRGAGVPLQHAHPGSAEAVEAVAHGHGKPGALGRLHQGQGRDAGAHPHAEAPWWVVQAVDKKRARLNCIAHLLKQIPYEDVPKPEIDLPQRVRHVDYERRPVRPELYVPELY